MRGKLNWNCIAFEVAIYNFYFDMTLRGIGRNKGNNKNSNQYSQPLTESDNQYSHKFEVQNKCKVYTFIFKIFALIIAIYIYICIYIYIYIYIYSFRKCGENYCINNLNSELFKVDSKYAYIPSSVYFVSSWSVQGRRLD
jgi:hypothetical protein